MGARRTFIAGLLREAFSKRRPSQGHRPGAIRVLRSPSLSQLQRRNASSDLALGGYMFWLARRTRAKTYIPQAQDQKMRFCAAAVIGLAIGELGLHPDGVPGSVCVLKKLLEGGLR